MTAPDLGSVAIQAALERAKVEPAWLQEVYMGCVLTAGIGQAPARQAMLKAGIPSSVGATTIGKVCGSGMKAVMLGRAGIIAQEAELIVAGGMESMSQTPHLLKGSRKGQKMGHQTMLDSMITDGLWDPYSDQHMGNCAERCAEHFGFTRLEQEAYTRASFQRALDAQASGSFATEIAPVKVPQHKGPPIMVSEDEGPGRANRDKLPQLAAAFEPHGSITAGTSSTIHDGAAALVLASAVAGNRHGLTPMARIVSVATYSHDPTWFTTAPVHAMAAALKKASLTAGDMDQIEINEAFAVVAMAAIRELNLDPAVVNTRGSGLSLGHPIGATGARLLVTLAHTLQQTGGRYGMASLCIGGGEATAMIIENLQ
jgi:acetyl-CoA C-acetyltransferase